MGDPPLMGAVPLEAHDGREPFVRGGGKHPPVPWLGIGWLSKHLVHLMASYLAPEDIDARDWMAPDPPEEPLDRVAAVIGGERGAASLAEALGRDVWIDYVSDTGDDDAVGAAVARMVSRAYEIDGDGGRRRILPRGEVLLFGGDTAYPVATEEEIRCRLVEPWNRVLENRPTAGMRVLLGVPGNHDWNDGLDGFGRLFRRRDRATHVEARRKDGGPLQLHGYEPVQNASYFALPLAPGIDMWAVDRQLTHLDYRQRQFFARVGHQREPKGRVLVQSDPHRVFCRDNPPGREVAKRLDLDLETEPHLVLSGDIHHYQHWEEGASTHVIAGGGGAALHGAAKRRPGMDVTPIREFPKRRDCKPLTRGMFARIATGGAGWFVHLVIGVAALLAGGLGAVLADGLGIALAGVALGLVAIFAGTSKLGHEAVGEALLLGAGIALPLGAVGWWMPEELRIVGDVLPVVLASAGAAILGGTAAAWGIASLTARGVDDYIGWATLAHPGFKHFLRLRVRKDGSGIDVWCLGQRNPCRQGEPVLVVDHFTWTP